MNFAQLQESGFCMTFGMHGLVRWAAILSVGCLCAVGQAGATDAEKSSTVVAISILDDLFFRDVAEGMKAQARTDGISLVQVNSNHDLATEAKLIDNAIRLKASAIVLSPADANLSVVALKKAHDSGIKIVAYNDVVNADFVLATVRSNQQALGASTGEAARAYIGRKLGGKARVGVLCFDALLPAQSDARVQGFLGAVRKLGADLVLVARKDAWEANTAIKVAGEMLKTYPDLDIIYAANEGGTVGAQLAVKSLAKDRPIKVFGTDSARQELDMLVAPDEILQAVTGQSPYAIGVKAMEAAALAIKGQAVQKNIYVDGILLSRDDKEALAKYREKNK